MYREARPYDYSIQGTLDQKTCTLMIECMGRPIGWCLIEHETDRGIYESVEWVPMMEVAVEDRRMIEEGPHPYVCEDCGLEANDEEAEMRVMGEYGG